MQTRVSYRARNAFEAKVKLLEAWVRDGVPFGIEVPKTITALARWKDPSLGLESWQKPNIHSPNGRYGDLRLRADAALEQLNSTAFKSHPSGGADNALSDKLMKQLIRLRGELVRV